MGTINTSDIIFATLTRNGRQVATLQLSGLDSSRAIMKRINDACASATSGLVKVVVRNCTQGWSHSHTMMMRPASVPVQLTLF